MRTQFSFVLASALLFSFTAANAGTSPTDPCRAKALAAAQAQYGLAPYRCTISTVSEGEKYKVYVGIGNPESGEDLYYVTFANGCDSGADAVEAPEVAINALQADTHAVYNRLVTFNTEIPAGDEVSASQLPLKAQKQYAATEKNFQLLLAGWAKQDGATPDLKLTVYKVQVDGQDTFAVLTPVLHDSIREDFYVVDAKGNEIDGASVYHTSDIGTNGVSWQNQSIQK